MKATIQTDPEVILREDFISEHKRRRTRNGKPSHYFDPGTLRWFSARVAADGWITPSGVIYFTESTQNRGFSGKFPRLYSVVAILPDGDICKVGGNERFASLSGAKAAAKRLAFEDPNPVFMDGNLRHAARLARESVELFEKFHKKEATEKQLENAREGVESWAKAAGCRVDWSHFKPGLLLPRARREVRFDQWTSEVERLQG